MFLLALRSCRRESNPSRVERGDVGNDFRAIVSESDPLLDEVNDRGGVCVPVTDALVGELGVGNRCGVVRSERWTAPIYGGRSATSIIAERVFCFLNRARS